MGIAGRVVEKELGARPRDLLHRSARKEAKRRVWNPEEEKIITRDDGGRYVNLFQVWDRHPVVFLAGAAVIAGLALMNLKSRLKR